MRVLCSASFVSLGSAVRAGLRRLDVWPPDGPSTCWRQYDPSGVVR